IFTRHHFQQGMISAVQYETYLRLYEGMVPFLPKPDLILYLTAPAEVLLRRIHARGRTYEQDISPHYLTELNELYETWAADCDDRLLRIDTTASEDAGQVFRQAMQQLGLPVTSKARAS
ncbi:MAG: deoxynucleoside kinase, partial [Candidatus Sericytochromatia bacterium]